MEQQIAKLDTVDEDIVYEIDQHDRLVYINEQWRHFARTNQAAYLADPLILHRPVWDFIVDHETNLIYEMLFSRVRKLSEPVSFTYRCDTPTERRFMRMELLPRPHEHIQLVSRVVQIEERSHTPLLDSSTKRSEEFLTVCSWCKRVRMPDGTWAEVEEAVQALHLFESPVLPQLTHGICPDCRASLSPRRIRQNMLV